MAQLSYCFAHSHRQRRYSLHPLQPAVGKLAVFFTGDFCEEKFGIAKDAGQGIVQFVAQNFRKVFGPILGRFGRNTFGDSLAMSQPLFEQEPIAAREP